MTSMIDDRRVILLGLAMSLFLPCRAQIVWSCANGKVHHKICLTRHWLTFPRGDQQVSFENRSSVTAKKVHFLAPQNVQK